MKLIFEMLLKTDKKRAGLATSPVKGSLNLKVSKGPEETTCRNQRFPKNFNLGEVCQGFPLFSRVRVREPMPFVHYFTLFFQINAFLPLSWTHPPQMQQLH